MTQTMTTIFNFDLKEIIINVVSIILLAISFISTIKQRQKAKNVSKIQAIYETIPEYVILAENIFGDGNGINKKEFVMTKIINFALMNNVKLDYNETSEQVESVVKATKNVNVSRETIEDTTETFHETETNNDIVEDVQSNNEIIIQNNEKVGEENGIHN